MKKLFSLVIILVAFCGSSPAQLNMTFLGQLTYSSDLASLTGYAANGKEYALVGAYGGLSIVDVTVPTSPTQVQFVSTSNSSWHEIKTWSHYAYVVNENGGGMLIVDLSGLPGSVTYVNYTGGALNLHTGHTLWIDENGICYVNGSNIANGGVVFLDLNTNAMNPAYLGQYDDYYVHDCYVRGDTMWTSEIYEGRFRVIDVSDKSNPIPLAQQNTPGNFNHNAVPSDNGKYLFTTDEVTNSYVTAYNVSDLSNISELDRFQANPGTSSIGHNVHVRGNFLVIAYYRDGVIIADATHPDNLIKVGYYDTSPLSGSGYNGCWEAYAFLPSGNIIAADIEEGLFVLGVTYKQACYLTGTVTDYSTGAVLNGVTVTIVNATDAITTTNLSGQYATGYVTAAKYSVTFSKAGYWTKTIANVKLTKGINKVLNASLKNTSLTQCSIPSNLSVDSITYTSAYLHWSDEYADSYTVRLKNLSTNQSQSLSPKVNFRTVTGLSPCTSYQFRVKAKCSSGTITGFSPWKNFVTSGLECRGVEQIASANENYLQIFPNPFSDEFNITLPLEEEEIVTVSLYDVSGRKLLSKNYDHTSAGINHFSFDASSLAEGVYVCLIQTSKGIVARRVAKVNE